MLDLQTGTPAPIAQLAHSVGFRYSVAANGEVRDEASSAARYAHGAAVVVASPDGHVSRYLMGVRFDPAELRLALVDASAGHIGSLTDRIALLCAHVDPRLGRYSGVLLDGMRVFGVALALLLGALVWRLQRRAARKAAP